MKRLLLFLALAATARSVTAQEPFATGADISFLPFYESQGVRYFEDSEADDFLLIARRNGWNTLRVRLWVDPAPDAKSQVSNLRNVTLLGQRIKAAGFRFLLDIHYSDTWADPGHQIKPKAWAALPFPALVRQVHDYSREVVAHLRDNGAAPNIVQVGNEIRNGLLIGSGSDGSGPMPGGGFWENDKGGTERALRLLAAGAQGVRGGSPSSQIMLHIPDGQDTAFVKWYFSHLEDAARAASPPVALEFDLLGLSYYPGEPWDRQAGYEPWHLSHLSDSLNFLATKFHKPLMIVETDWPQAGTVEAIPGAPEFAFSPAGQAQFYSALIRVVREVPDGLGAGVLTWEPDTLNWQSVFDAKGNALAAVRALGGK